MISCRVYLSEVPNPIVAYWGKELKANIFGFKYYFSKKSLRSCLNLNGLTES